MAEGEGLGGTIGGHPTWLYVVGGGAALALLYLFTRGKSSSAAAQAPYVLLQPGATGAPSYSPSAGAGGGSPTVVSQLEDAWRQYTAGTVSWSGLVPGSQAYSMAYQNFVLGLQGLTSDQLAQALANWQNLGVLNFLANPQLSGAQTTRPIGAGGGGTQSAPPGSGVSVEAPLAMAGAVPTPLRQIQAGVPAGLGG